MHPKNTRTCVKCGARTSKTGITLCRSCYRGAPIEPPNPGGLCMCGCGQPVPRADHTHRKSGTVKGEYVKYLIGHHRRSSPVEYIVDPDTGCWNWQLFVSARGYGRSGGKDHSSSLAHRVVYERLVGPIPEGLQLDHLCRNPRCVNPAHLEPVTQNVNQRRGNNAKLTKPQVDDIRARYAAGGESHRSLARQFGVTHQTIASIVTNKKWLD